MGRVTIRRAITSWPRRKDIRPVLNGPPPPLVGRSRTLPSALPRFPMGSYKARNDGGPIQERYGVVVLYPGTHSVVAGRL